jgi:hypothetical protein
MAFDQKGKFEFVAPNVKEGKFLWKYLDLHKLIDLIASQELHFNRLDLFEDPIEGLSTRNLRATNLLELINESENVELIEKIKDKHPNLLENHDLESAFRAVKQRSQFVNCWFHDNRESMAMWNLYSNYDSVALKVKAKSLTDYLEKIGEDFISRNGYRISLLSNKVEYLPLNPFDSSLPLQKRKYASFKKDLSYKHEQEYRFLIYANQQMAYDENDIKFYRLPIDLEKIDLEIICHPLMLQWKRNNIRKLLEKFKRNIIVSKSSIYLRK